VLANPDGTAVFIDLETARLGPRDWDLAHLEPAVAAHVSNIDTAVLHALRLGTSALAAAHCSDGVHRGPDMIHHANHHIGVVRAGR
jgi:hypothetical protein